MDNKTNKPVVNIKPVVKPDTCKGCSSYDSCELCYLCSIALTFKNSF